MPRAPRSASVSTRPSASDPGRQRNLNLIRIRSTLLAILVLVLAAMPGSGTAWGQPAAFDGEAAFALLEKQVDFGPRNPGSEAHDQMLKWMLD